MRIAGLRRTTAKFRWHAELPREKKKLAAVLAVLLIFLVLTAVISERMRPLVKAMAVSALTDTVQRQVNAAVVQVMSDEGLEYGDLVTLQKDAGGKITALTTNMAEINSLQAELSGRILDTLSDESDTVIRIPITNILGSSLFAGRGPRIPVKIVSVTNIGTSFSNQFTAAGINQTRHQILLTVTVNINYLIPGAYTTTQVTTDVCVAETVIVGSVPDAYAEVKQ